MGEVNQEQRSFLAWNILTDYAKRNEKITYGKLAELMGIHHRPIRYVLEIIQDYCMQENKPPLTILVVNQSGLPGSGFIAWDLDNYEEGLNNVFNYDWSSLENPFEYAAEGMSVEELTKDLIQAPGKSQEVFAKIKVRGIAQQVFRNGLLKIYDNKCAFCGFSHSKALEASHIKEWSACKENEKLDLSNGLLLCSVHHKLFDSNVLIVNDDYVIDKNKNIEIKSEYDKYLISDLIGNKISLPHNTDFWPNQQYLSHHAKKAK